MLLALHVQVLRVANFMFVVAPAPFVLLTGQSQKKIVSPITKKIQIKTETCFFCRSVSFCHSCDKCPQCCRRYSCRGPIAKILAGLGSKGFESKGGFDIEGGIQPQIEDLISSH